MIPAASRRSVAGRLRRPAGSPRVRRRPDGALLGGSPLRLVRLAPRARDLLAGDRLVVRDATTAELAGRLLDAGLAAPDLPGPRCRTT